MTLKTEEAGFAGRRAKAEGLSIRIGIAWIAGAVAILGALLFMRSGGTVRGFDLDNFAQLPVLEGGRVKPIDSIARNSLLMIRGKQTFRQDGREVGPDEWLLDVMFRPEVAETQPIFNVDSPDVLGMLGRKQTADRYLTYSDMSPYLDEIQRQGQNAHQIDAKRRSRFENAIVNLYDRLYLFLRLSNVVHRSGEATLADLIVARDQPGAAARAQEIGDLAFFRILPPLPGQGDDGWKNVGEALQESATGEIDPRLQIFANMEQAWAGQDAAEFNRALADALAPLTALHPDLLARANDEVIFNRAEPFYVGMIIYVLALMIAFLSGIWFPKTLRSVAFGLLVGGAIVHTTGLIARMILQGRPPVTNLYSSAVFVGWGVVILGIIFERVYRRGIATGVAAAVGFTTLLIAHHLAADGDTLEMMRAVLDSNFWLGTHVVTVTTGYAGTFLAGAIAVTYALRRQFVPRPDPESGKALVSMAYGVLCFSLLFSFVGTVLGGIWADQSWGRFWGWDPKENGALLIVLWNAIVLHARMGGFVRERGLMTMAIFGNVVTSLSWFGVNMLGIGLHSYGFMDKAFWSLSAFVGLQVVLAVLCLLPPHTLLPRLGAARREPEPAPTH